MKKKASEILTKALELLGPRGKFWIKKSYKKTHKGQKCFCAVGALQAASPRLGPSYGQAESVLRSIVSANYGYSAVESFNDREESKWSEIRSIFNKAIKLAEKEERA